MSFTAAELRLLRRVDAAIDGKIHREDKALSLRISDKRRRLGFYGRGKFPPGWREALRRLQWDNRRWKSDHEK